LVTSGGFAAVVVVACFHQIARG